MMGWQRNDRMGRRWFSAAHQSFATRAGLLLDAHPSDEAPVGHQPEQPGGTAMESIHLERFEVPVLGFGTYGLRGDACIEAVADALRLGYRHLDTAEVYENEDAVGAAIREAGIGREELFITTKASQEDLSPDAVRRSLDASLRKLDTDSVDLWLIHWPNPDYPLRDTLEAMATLADEGRAKYLGVSNFSPELFAEAAGIAPIACNQVKYHPYYPQDENLAAVRERDAFLTAYSPLAKSEVGNDEVLREIGERHGKSAAQVTLRWLIQQPRVAAIPKAASAQHRRANIAVFDFELDTSEMERIAQLAET
jgi:diketogulonate reductase-like aldo/keto reductase